MASHRPPVDPPGCYPYNHSLARGSYGYQPGLAPGVTYSVLFGLSAAYHLGQCWVSKAWWQMFFVLGAAIECMGWIARSVSHACAYTDELFTMQTSLLIMAPAFTQAGIYVVYWQFVNIIGREHSPVPPRVYLFGTLCLDAITLSLQATGGGLAASAYHNGGNPQPGTVVMIVGIMFQLVLACIFLALYTTMLMKGGQQISESKPLTLTTYSTIFVILCVVWRGIYRSIELVQGWRGFLIEHEIYTIANDGLPIILAAIALNILNPGMLLRKLKEERGIKIAAEARLAAQSSDGEREKRNLKLTVTEKFRSCFLS